jgi:DNA-binding transcriptional LysR family regulator
MEIRQLKYFVSAVRHGSVKAAAGENFVTQPAVSIQLKKLEDEVGQKLYVRSGRRIRPTQAGSFLFAQAEDILQRLDTLFNSLEGFKGLDKGYLRLGNIDAASIYVLPAVFRKFQRKYPGVDIQVMVDDSERLAAALGSGAIELAIVTLPMAGENMEVTPFYQDQMVLVASPRHELVSSRLNRRRPLRYAAETGIITYPAQSTTRRLIEKVFMENELTLRASMEMSSPEAIKRLTESGLGVSILPRKVVAGEVRRGTLRVIPTGRVRFVRKLGVVHKGAETLSRPARVFLDMLLERYKSSIAP